MDILQVSNKKTGWRQTLKHIETVKKGRVIATHATPKKRAGR